MPTFMQILALHLMIEMVASMTFFPVSKDNIISFIEETTESNTQFTKAGPENTKGLSTTFPFCTCHEPQAKKFNSCIVIPLSHN